jgi:hypothetical protein
MSGDRARGDWTAWPVMPGQLELPVEDARPEADRAPDQGEHDE